MAIKDKVILIVDDDPEIIKLLSKIFEVLGVIVYSAKNLEEAKKIIYSAIPHLIFLDLNLGQENGLDYITFLKTLPFSNTLPVVIFSGEKDKKKLEEAQKFRPIDIIKKPIVARELIQKTRKFLKDINSTQIIFNDYLDTPQSFKVSGKILKINQNSIEVESSIKFGANSIVKVESPFIEQLDFFSGKFSTGTYVQTLDLGQYLNKLFFVAITDGVIQKIKGLRYK